MLGRPHLTPYASLLTHLPFPRMPSTSLAYRLLLRIGVTFARGASLFEPKLARGFAARRGLNERLRAWGTRERNLSRPLAWFHAASVGEGLQARAVIEAFRARHPSWQVAYTFFSPSAERFAESVAADVRDYAPFDLRGNVVAALDALAPSLLVFSKLDLWPELATAAAGRGVPVALIAGTVRPGSGRTRLPARALLAPGYASVARAGVIADADADRLTQLGLSRDRITVTGDPRADSVLARVAAVPTNDPLLTFGNGAPTLVAGSTWPHDEDVVLSAFARLRETHGDARLILVPHEPTGHALARIERQAESLQLPAPTRLSSAGGPAPLLLVDRVGALAELYGAGTMAYVGGGFGRAGLHSVLEPAAWGVPVAVGPRWQESRDAVLLQQAGALAPLTADDAVETMTQYWRQWISDETERKAQGARARQVVEADRGAAARSVAMLEELISGA